MLIRILNFAPIFIQIRTAIRIWIRPVSLDYILQWKITVKNSITNYLFFLKICLKNCPKIMAFLPVNFYNFNCVDPDSQSCWIRIQYGSGSTTLLKCNAEQKRYENSAYRKKSTRNSNS